MGLTDSDIPRRLLRPEEATSELAKVLETLADPEVCSNYEEVLSLTATRDRLAPIVAKWESLQDLRAQLAGFTNPEGEQEMAAGVREECASLLARIAMLETEVGSALDIADCPCEMLSQPYESRKDWHEDERIGLLSNCGSVHVELTAKWRRKKSSTRGLLLRCTRCGTYWSTITREGGGELYGIVNRSIWRPAPNDLTRMLNQIKSEQRDTGADPKSTDKT